MAVSDRIEADGGESLFREVKGCGGLAAPCVQYVAVHLARVDERLNLRLRLADAPRRAEALEFLGVAAVCRFEHLLFWLRGHTPCLSICLIYVNIVDMRDFLEDQPLGYLLYRAHNALRAEVTTTVLEPLGLAFPQYICMRILSHIPGSVERRAGARHQRLAAGDEHGAARPRRTRSGDQAGECVVGEIATRGADA